MRSLAALRAAALAVLAGAVGALVWWRVAPRAQIVIRSDGGFFVDPDPEQYAASDAWFALVALVLGVLVGLIVWRVGRRHATATVVGLAVGGLAGSFVMRYLGQWLGRVDLAAVEHLPVGTVVSAPLRLQAPAVLLVLPVVSLATWLLCDLVSDYRVARAAQAAAVTDDAPPVPPTLPPA